MAILNFAGFETGDTSECFSTSGTVSVQNSTARNSGYALRCNPTTSGTGFANFRGLDVNGVPISLTTGADRYLRFYFNFATKPGSGSEIIAEVPSVGAKGSLNLRIRINSSGVLLAYATNTLLATGTTVLSSGMWYRIEIKRVAGSTAAWEVRIDGVSEISGTANFHSSTGNTITLGKSVDVSSQSVDFFYDDMLLSNSAYPGAGQCSVLLPTANGNYQTWSIGAGSGSNYQQVNERPPNGDTSYLLSPLITNDFETEALADGVASGTVNCVKSVAVIKKNVSGGTVRVALRSGATDDITTLDYTATSSYVSLFKLYPTDPATSSAWVLSALDSVETGAKCTSAVNQVRMTFTAVMVDYTPSSGGSVGSATGTATVTGTGASLVAGVGVSTGAATVSSTGTALASAVGSVSGTATVTAIGAALATAVGSAAGAATVTSVGASLASSAGTASGIATTSGIGASLAVSEGSIVGVATIAGTSTSTSTLPPVIVGGGSGNAPAKKKLRPALALERRKKDVEAVVAYLASRGLC